jgi:hypothetical protein
MRMDAASNGVRARLVISPSSSGLADEPQRFVHSRTVR